MSNTYYNNILDISSSQEQSTTPTPIKIKEVKYNTSGPEDLPDTTNTPEPLPTHAPFNDSIKLTSNVITPSYFGSIRLYFNPEYERYYNTKFIAKLSDINYIQFNGDNNNVDIYEGNTDSISFNILSTYNPSYTYTYIGLNFCSYKNNIIDDFANKIGTVILEPSNKFFNYKYSNTSDNVDRTEIEISAAYCNESLYKELPKINISYSYHTFTSYNTHSSSVTGNIQINLLSLNTENKKYNFQNIEIYDKLYVPFGLSKNLFKNNGKCSFRIITNDGSDGSSKYDILKSYFKYNNNKDLPTDYNIFTDTPIQTLYLKNYPSENISITLQPYVRYNRLDLHTINCSYTVTINVPGTRITATDAPSNTGSPTL